MPNWLGRQGGDPGAAFTGGFNAGAGVAMERNRLKQAAAEANMQAQARSDALEAETLREKHKIEIDQAYQQAQLGLKAQSLEQEQQRIAVGQQRAALASQNAARRFRAQQEYTTRVKAGENASQVLLELGPQLTDNMSGLASLAKDPSEGFTPGPAEQVSGGPANLFRAQVSKNQYQYFQDRSQAGALEGKTIPGTDNQFMDIGGKPYRRIAPKDSAEVTRWKKIIADQPANPGPAVKKLIADLEAKIAAATSTGAGATPAVKRYVYDPKTGEYKPKE